MGSMSSKNLSVAHFDLKRKLKAINRDILESQNIHEQ